MIDATHIFFGLGRILYNLCSEFGEYFGVANDVALGAIEACRVGRDIPYIEKCWHVNFCKSKTLRTTVIQ
jgi:hypothetical protein